MIKPTEEMIVIKGEIKTSSVKSCLYNPSTQKWDVTFSNGKTFPYAYYNVEKLRSPETLNLSEYSMQVNGQTLGGVKEVYAFQGQNWYYHVVFDKGYYKDYCGNEVTLVKSAFKTKKSKDLWGYLSQISEISKLQNDFGELILKKQFEKIGFISEENALSPYLNATVPGKRNKTIPIFPFGCNTSQYEAVEKAINNQLSVIQGPPGTGKTQTILNIIANLLISGKTVQVVSNNNSAIENVQEKLASPKYNLGFIVAKLGKGENKKQFIDEQRTAYPDFSGWEYKGDLRELSSEIQTLSQKLKVVYADEEKIARLTSEKSAIEVEKVHFDQYVKETGAVISTIKFKKKARSSDIMRVWQILLDKSEGDVHISFWQKLIFFFRYGLRDKKIIDQDPALSIPSLQSMFYGKRTEEIDEEVVRLKKDAESMHVNTDELTAK